MIAVNVVEGGPETFNALCYSEKHPSTLQFLQNQFQNIQSTLVNAGNEFLAGTRAIYDRYNDSEAMRRARLALNKVQNIFKPDNIHSLWELQDIQNAQLVMQRWIMANPIPREMYHKQLLDGYSDSYVDNFPEDVGESHYDYRRVMHGVVQDCPENDFKIVHYLDELYEGDRELSLEEQADILSTWDIVNAILKRNEDDPTSPYGAML